MKLKQGKSIKIGTTLGLTTSIILTTATLGIAFYALFFLDQMFRNLVLQDEFYRQLLIFEDTLKRLVVASVVFGLVASYYMTKIILNPLSEIVKGTEELSNGNFKYRFKPSRYFEINRIVETYNKMAENLENLYTELENKVLERTIELQNANMELKNTQAMMVHSEKMRSLGQLVAGITHEINNPINFVYGNMIHLKKYTNALIEIINLYEMFEDELSEEKRVELKSLKEQAELTFIKEDLPNLLNSCYEGTERTKNIILDLKNFSRFEEVVINNIDLKKEIDTTLNILHNKIKSKVKIIKYYDKDMPLIEGYGGQLNQVFMNILDNACYAVKEGGEIRIRLQKKENSVIIEFEDTGCGMNKEQIDKIFDPFYTTKPAGSGTGLGMSISYKVIQKHNGKIVVESTEGKGTKFTISLPMRLEKLGIS